MDIKETIQEHKLLVLSVSLGILIVCLGLAVILLVHENKKPKGNPDEIMISIDPVILMLPEEPLTLPPVQYSRKQKKIWTETDMQYWYTIPDMREMQKLHDLNERQIQQLWESVP